MAPEQWWKKRVDRMIDRHYPKIPVKRYEMIEEVRALADLQIPKDPQEFYADIGLFSHPLTGEPVPKLAPYQYRYWKDKYRYKYRLGLKSQKIGLTSSTLLEDFQSVLLEGRGRDLLIIAQSLQHAREHLYTLRKHILASPKYNKFLIRKPTDLLMRDEVTKVTVLYINNPQNPYFPNRIIGLGPRETGLWSWKNVFEVHMSDITVTMLKDDSGLFGATFSRLANTNGRLKIETPPRLQRGFTYQIWKQSKAKDPKDKAPEGRFKTYEMAYTEAIAAGVMTQEFIDAEKDRLGALFPMYYECEFLAPGTVWYPEELLETDTYDITW